MTHFLRGAQALQLLLALFIVPIHAADIDAGKAKAAICAGCHGMNGISSADLWPNLAGQKATYLAQQIRAFRDGERAEPTMAAMTKSLTNEDIDNLAAYYSSLPCN